MDAPVVDEEYLEQVKKVYDFLRLELFPTIPGYSALMLRFAWNDAGTYDVQTKTGGPNGSIRNSELLEHEEYRELQKASEICEVLKILYPRITYADLIQLAGVVAVEVTDGPKINFVPGRKDSLASPEEGRIPAANQGVQQKMATFHRMGLSHQDIVALSGGLSLGRKEQESCRVDDVIQIPMSLRFIDSSYFMKILIGEHVSNVMIHPADRALLEDDNLRHYVLEYAQPQNEDAFFRDYAEAHQKFSELGFISSDDEVEENRSTLLVQRFLPVAVTAVVAVLCYLFEVRRKVE